jgi:lipopolysaccharide biosynthesis protein
MSNKNKFRAPAHKTKPSVRNNKLIVVLGMHRSGTSAVARALSALGVCLGDNLMPGVEGNNDKGFFEDIDIAAFNTSLLCKLDSSWDDLRLLDSHQLLDDKFSAERAQALSLIASKFSSDNVFAFKDPRTSLLLPFWKAVFTELEYDVHYIFVLRNPISVAKSLTRRDGITEIKGLLLWAKYVLSAILECAHTKTQIIDYDQLFFDTENKLLISAERLNLAINSFNRKELAVYASEFLTTELRHNVATLDELNANSSIPDIVKKAYASLTLASTQREFITKEQAKLLAEELAYNSPLFSAYQNIDDEKNKLFWHAKELDQRLAARDADIYKLQQSIKLFEDNILNFKQAQTELEKSLEDKSTEMAVLEDNVRLSEECIAQFKRTQQALEESLHDKNAQINKLLDALKQEIESRADNEVIKMEASRCVDLQDELRSAKDSQTAVTHELQLAWHEIERFKSELHSIDDSRVATTHELHLAWHEIERLKYAYVQQEFFINGLLKSASWTLTKPFRFLRRNLVSKPAIFLRQFSVRAIRAIWRRLPVSSSLRHGLKSFLFAKTPIFFKGTEIYAQWQFSKSHSEFNQEHEQSSTLKAQSSAAAGIPRITFDTSEEVFVDHKENDKINPLVKVIAFYLPQFHPFPENDQWWGKGFTEWTNVGKARPNYEGHHQPHHPIHLGYYDLRVPDVMEEQARLAKQYGIYGFNYYFYWFAGKILMDTPLEAMLQNKKIDIPFCLTWANENWTRRWDGQENDVLIAQDHSDKDSLDFIRHLIRYFKDERYIRVDGKPVLMIYRASIIPNMAATAKLWRKEAQKHGIPDLYLVCAQSFGIRSPHEFGFDASAEFPPHTVQSTDIREQLNLINPEFKGYVFSYDQVVEHAVRQEEPDYKLFRTAMLSWDNTARKQDHSHIFHGFSLLRYKQWLGALCNQVYNNPKYALDEKIVFVNAWNEWAEGTHLEPDRKYGYGYLQSTYDVLSNYDSKYQAIQNIRRLARRNDYAVIVHAHYPEVIPSIITYLRNLDRKKFDLFVTATSAAIFNEFIRYYPDVNLRLVENRGRDVLPFLSVYRDIVDLGYEAVCKVHTKRSLYREDGDTIRDEQIYSLLGSEEIVTQNLKELRDNSTIGLLAPEKYLIDHTDHNMTYDHAVVADVCSALGIKFEYSKFPAGSMFWFKPKSLELLLNLNQTNFPIESGLADGTPAHAVERVFALAAGAKGFFTVGC